jgi:putative flippase GtrA
LKGKRSKDGLFKGLQAKLPSTGSDKKHATLAHELVFYYIFSVITTLFQYLAFTILPYAFGLELAGVEFMWPQIPMTLFGVSFRWNILGYEIARDAAGHVIIGGGLGYFLAYELGTFLAQCINFPLQRNITFRSHGSIPRQAFWYLIAWILISLFCNAVNGLWIPLAQVYVDPAIYNILVTFITGGVSMVIYFFAFKIIFPEGKPGEKKAA